MYFIDARANKTRRAYTGGSRGRLRITAHDAYIICPSPPVPSHCPPPRALYTRFLFVRTSEIPWTPHCSAGLVAIYLEIEAGAAVVGKDRDKEGTRGSVAVTGTFAINMTVGID